MSIKVGINGFGRIGRNVLRAALAAGKRDLEFVAVNDITDAKTLAHLLKYDSVHGTLERDGAAPRTRHWSWTARASRYSASAIRPSCPGRTSASSVVLECTGLFTDRDKAAAHLTAGAKKVIISAPAKGADLTICYGVNHAAYEPSEHHVVSNASCTTNCLAPVAKVLHERFGIERGLMTTVHAYTNDQQILDLPHKDLRRARAAALSMIPTTTGAAQAIGEVLPELKGKLDGMAIRVPTPNVSIVDLAAELKQPATEQQVNDAHARGGGGPAQGHPRLHRRGAGLDRLQRHTGVVDRRPRR